MIVYMGIHNIMFGLTEHGKMLSEMGYLCTSILCPGAYKLINQLSKWSLDRQDDIIQLTSYDRCIIAFLFVSV